MEYGIDIRFFTEFGIRKAAEIAAKAGFTQLDYTGPVWEDDWKQQIKEAYAIFQDLGLNVHQTHQGTDAVLLHGGCARA